MTVVEFNGPGLNEEQWKTVRTVATQLKPQQALWLSGYFAGLADAGRPDAAHLVPAGLDPAPVAAAAPVRTLTILYGSETGNSEKLAHQLSALAAEHARAKVNFNLGPLALYYLLENGGSGYFRTRVVEPHIKSGALELVPHSPEFAYPVYLIYSRNRYSSQLE